MGMGQRTRHWSMVQWLQWSCLMSTLLEGRACVDSPTAIDAYGDGCSWYSGNPHGCGLYDTTTFVAARDCCTSCRPAACEDTGETDSGGDNCSFYDEKPEFCGCCDTPSFKADTGCCACRQVPQGTAAWWTNVFHAWPRKAVRLRLRGKSLQGTLPPTIGLLVNLKTLDLRGNALGGRLPPELGDLSDLEYLNLAENQFSGSLPAELGKLSNLQHLGLWSNELSGSLPAELGNCSQLQELWLHENQFSGSLPAELGNCSQLEDLRLYRNQLSGRLPAELGKLSQLSSLELHLNQLSGSLPAELSNLSQLWFLDLHSNHLSGALSGALPESLWILDLSNNTLSGSLPAELGKMSQLWRLNLGINHLSGNLPAELGSLSQLEMMVLHRNQLNGSLPAELGNLSQLSSLNLHFNQLSGSIPAELGKLSHLQYLGLGNNQLSGSIPAELGKLSRLLNLVLNENLLSGSLPAELGKLSRLQQLNLHSNLLNGTLPAELGNLSRLQGLYLDYNQLEGGLPTSYRELSLLTVFSAKRNPHFCGSTDAITELRHLRRLELRGCCFQTIARPPPSLAHLDLGENNLTAVPESIQALPNVTTLLLDSNNIEWDTSSIVPLSWYKELLCEQYLRENMPPRPAWPKLARLNVSSNLISPPVHDFLATLVHLPNLQVLLAADNRLSGGMPGDFPSGTFMENRPHTDCHYPPDFETLMTVFPALVTLDLSRNHITHLLSPPPTRLFQMYLTGNQLTAGGLSDHWWQGAATPEGVGGNALVFISILGNPALRLPIRLDPGSSCQDSGVLVANAEGWNPAAAAPGSECTTLCQGQPQVLVDVSAQEEVLCRCGSGQGAGLNCTVCPVDTYSVQSFDRDRGHYVRSCRMCPLHSELRNSAGQCFGDCSCIGGYFMQKSARGGNRTDLGSATCRLLLAEAQLRGQAEVDLEGECSPCDIWRTSQAGSRTQADCLCNGNRSNGGWSGLLQEGSECRCPDGERIDFAQRACVPCEVAEICIDWKKGLKPPEVMAGFWALPPPPPGSDGTYGGFSRHSIWRCDSPEACPGNFTCDLNRTGTACSICQRGWFRTPGGACSRCPLSYSAARLLLLGLLIASTIIPLLAHGLLTVVDDSSRGQMMALRSFRISLKQLLKFMQILGVVSLFQVEWPALVLSIFGVFRALSVDFASWTGVACLDAQQQETVALELAFRWMLPVLAATVTAASAVAATGCGLLLCRRRRETRLGRLLHFGFFDVLRVLLFLLQLFYPSILKNAVLPLTCSPSPNGHLTMNMYPHLVCFDLKHDEGFWPLALLGGVFTVLLIVGYPYLLFRLRRRLTELVKGEDVASASWWTFVFDDYRPDCRHSVLVVVGKDILLNLVAVVLPGLGTFQLLVTAMVSSGYTFWVHISKPFYDTSNTVLEACTSAAVAILCVFSAGMGFQSEPEVLDISAHLKDGRSNPVYLQRALTLVCLQGLSLFAPAAVLGFQVLAAFERTRRYLPRALVPASDEQLQAWRQDAHATLDQLDDVSLTSLHHLVMSSAAARRSLPQASSKKDGPQSRDVEQPVQPSPSQPYEFTVSV